ncbi:Mu transposase domain-containing protein [Nonomuraea sp. NPDC049400]|uniref:Mu transposase domain-containing protein n=1 Tax=Nonomuraea sp. NPDC049400 TaxID=3364352 RepID=UPI0037AC2867
MDIVRDHVLAGRSFSSIAELDAAFAAWVPIRRATVHRTHGELIGQRAARDHAALAPLPASAYLVAERHLRRVGKDCLVSFEGSLYSVPARRVRAGQRVELRVTGSEVTPRQVHPASSRGLRCR